jgi:hypothetical protein
MADWPDGGLAGWRIADVRRNRINPPIRHLTNPHPSKQVLNREL